MSETFFAYFACQIRNFGPPECRNLSFIAENCLNCYLMFYCLGANLFNGNKVLEPNWQKNVRTKKLKLQAPPGKKSKRKWEWFQNRCKNARATTMTALSPLVDLTKSLVDLDQPPDPEQKRWSTCDLRSSLVDQQPNLPSSLHQLSWVILSYSFLNGGAKSRKIIVEFYQSRPPPKS